MVPVCWFSIKINHIEGKFENFCHFEGHQLVCIVVSSQTCRTVGLQSSHLMLQAGPARAATNDMFTLEVQVNQTLPLGRE